MRVTGLHVLAEIRDSDKEMLQDLHQLETLMKDAAAENGFVVEDSVFHQYNQDGISGVLIVPDANLSIHTWPENGRVTVDMVACRENINLFSFCEDLASKFKAASMTAQYSKREIEVGSASEAMAV